MNPLVVIPARGGSKGILGKNIKFLGKKPLIQYTIEAAREVFSDDHICVSTDSEEIKKVVENLGLKVPFLRPSHLAKDESSSYDVVMHALEYYRNNGYTPDTIILLQVTSPFRTARHIQDSLKEYNLQCEMVVSVKTTKANPYYNLLEEGIDGWLIKSKYGKFTRRQDCPVVYEMNGAIYIINAESLFLHSMTDLIQVKKYVMDEISSIDIDSPFDWEIAELMLPTVLF